MGNKVLQCIILYREDWILGTIVTQIIYSTIENKTIFFKYPVVLHTKYLLIMLKNFSLILESIIHGLLKPLSQLNYK